jgi:hypothetical protein
MTASTTLQRLVLRATTDGWALLTDGGAVVFRRAGSGARHACLAFASEHGVLSLVT